MWADPPSLPPVSEGIRWRGLPATESHRFLELVKAVRAGLPRLSPRQAAVGLLLLLLAGPPVAAQDHPLLDERGWYLMRDRVGLAPARATALCNNPTSTVDAARARATLAATAAERSPQVAAAWRELTCARVALWAADARATESYLMPLGTSWDVGAYRALERWLALSPEDSQALNLLAAVIVDLGDRPKEVGRDGG